MRTVGDRIDGVPEIALSCLQARYPNTMAVHFGSSRRSRFYPQALGLLEFADASIEHGSEASRWHTVLVDDGNLDLLALLHGLAVKLPGPKVCGADALAVVLKCRHGGKYDSSYTSGAKLGRVTQACDQLHAQLGMSWRQIAEFLEVHILKPVQVDMSNAFQRLQLEGFLDRPDTEDPIRIIRAWRRPQEIHPDIRRIRDAVAREDYQEAVEKYYQMLGGSPYGELTPELLYLKRLGGIELEARDLLFFLPPTARRELVQEHLSEFAECADEAIADYSETSSRLVEILAEGAPTMEELVRRTQDEIRREVWLEDSTLTRDDTVITPEFFGARYGLCPAGRIFHKYPDQVALCEAFEHEEDPKYHGFWVAYSEAFMGDNVFDKGLTLVLVDAYRHRGWNWRGKRGSREPPFETATSLAEIEKSSYGVSGIRYTGRHHRIREKDFFEVDLIRTKNQTSLGNPFLEAVHEVLRESENLLRERHGIPRIGEGWVSELRLYNLVREVFPGAAHQAKPEWLNPQHLDVFVAESGIAFEYQGRQHFEPVDFFGGEDAFKRLRERDTRKARLCKKHGVLLVAWHYDWPLTREYLMEVLRKASVEVPDDREESHDSPVGD